MRFRGDDLDNRRRCRVCNSGRLVVERLANPRRPRTITAVSCESCRYVRIPENEKEYKVAKRARQLGGGRGPRMGTWDEPGREFKMAKLGLDLVRRKNASVLMYGAGQSIDNHHVAKLGRVGRVVIGDLVQTRHDAEFINTGLLATEKFDVVVASEVLEHFPDPYENFDNLFSYVKDDGIIVASTNIRDGLPMSKVSYIWCGGHVSYWSPQALRIIARAFDMHLDFRVPKANIGRAGPRKRYVLFSRSPAVMEAVADWFGAHMYAPSEDPWAERHEAPTPIPDGPIAPSSGESSVAQ
jgi:SAM-dependent methyltransferase